MAEMFLLLLLARWLHAYLRRAYIAEGTALKIAFSSDHIEIGSKVYFFLDLAGIVQ